MTINCKFVSLVFHLLNVKSDFNRNHFLWNSYAIELMKNGSSSYRWSHMLNYNAGCINVKNFKELIRYDIIDIRKLKGNTYWSYGKQLYVFISYVAHSPRALEYIIKGNRKKIQKAEIFRKVAGRSLDSKTKESLRVPSLAFEKSKMAAQSHWKYSGHLGFPKSQAGDS